jgi:lysophospholipase L1-like esterase
LKIARLSVPLAALVLLGVGCGGSKAPLAPTPASRSVVFTAFLDENRNGLIDAGERIRIPGASVSFGSTSGPTAPLTGEATLNVIQTAQLLSVNPSSLPPFFRASEGALVTPPLEGSVPVPITLPLGPGAVPGVYLAFGDSITDGQAGVGDGQGYTGQLERALSAHFGFAKVINDGIDSSSSERGDARISASLASGRPAFTLILYGTNDWSDPRCQKTPCFTIDNLRSIVRKVKAAGGFAFVGTLLMTNLGDDFRASPQRNAWIVAQNGFIREMAESEGAVLVDLYAAFEKSPLPWSDLFADYIHPSAAGYTLMAQTWFDAITRGR